MSEAYIIDAVRTPRGIGKPGKGALSHLHPQHLGATVLRALKDRNNLNTAHVDDVIFSTSTQKGKQGGDLGRMAALAAGYDITASGMTLDRFCGGGITAVNLAAAQVMSGMEDLVIAGGTEMMSHVMDYGAKVRAAGVAAAGGLGTGNARLQARHPQSNQGVAADAIAAIEGISRADLEKFGVESQRRAAIAIKEGRFAKSTVPVLDDDGNVVLDHEEYPRPDTTVETLAGMKPAFEMFRDMPSGPGAKTYGELIQQKYPDVEIKGVHHVGTSSGVVDGAGAGLIGTAPDELERTGGRYRLVTMCGAGGMAPAVIIKRLNV